ncbi:hypothetical protein KJ616_00140 [Patescibacteria group bacterium]|nr:hypothetical protein [Patescibacteria group bacterium]
MDVIYWVIIALLAVGLAVLLINKGFCKCSKKKNVPPASTPSNTGESE